MIQSASFALWILHWNSPGHPPHPILPHATSMLEDSLCQHCLSYHSPLEYSLLSPCHSLSCFFYSLFLYVLISSFSVTLSLAHIHTQNCTLAFNFCFWFCTKSIKVLTLFFSLGVGIQWIKWVYLSDCYNVTCWHKGVGRYWNCKYIFWL